ncbi:unnamed protein product [Prunus armeniaca]
MKRSAGFGDLRYHCPYTASTTQQNLWSDSRAVLSPNLQYSLVTSAEHPHASIRKTRTSKTTNEDPKFRWELQLHGLGANGGSLLLFPSLLEQSAEPVFFLVKV